MCLYPNFVPATLNYSWSLFRLQTRRTIKCSRSSGSIPSGFQSQFCHELGDLEWVMSLLWVSITSSVKQIMIEPQEFDLSQHVYCARTEHINLHLSRCWSWFNLGAHGDHTHPAVNCLFTMTLETNKVSQLFFWIPIAFWLSLLCCALGCNEYFAIFISSSRWWTSRKAGTLYDHFSICCARQCLAPGKCSSNSW